MKTKVIIWTIIAVALCVGMASAQVTPSTQRMSLTGNDRAILDKRISKYTAFTIDKKELDNLYGDGRAGQFRLRVDETLDWTIDLELNDMRASDYKATYTTDKGTFEVDEPFVVNTFKGKTSDGKIARFTIDENTFFGVILGDNYHYVIRPAKDYTQNKEDKSFIVYKSWDIIPDDDHFDYINDVLEVTEDTKNGSVDAGMMSTQISPNYTTASSSCPNYYLKIATDADFEFHQARGGTGGSADAPARNQILSVLNIAEGVYESTFGLKFRVTFQHVYTTNSQPYLSTNASTLLTQFRNHWDSNRTDIPRNIAHLFTGKSLDGLTVGLSYPGQLHNPFLSMAYGLSMDHSELESIAAHEIGHNLNARHEETNPLPTDCLCDDPSDPFRENSSLMCPVLGAPRSLWFCQKSINEISSFLQANRLELAGICGPIGPSNAVCSGGSSFELTVPPTSTVTWGVTGPFSFSPTANQTLITGNPVTVYRTGTGTDNGILTAIVGGSFIASASITPCLPPPTISGSTTICSGSPATFTASNFPANATWDKSPNLTLSSTSSNPVTVSANGSGSGYVSIKVGTVELTRLNVWVGKPNVTVTGDSKGRPGGTYPFDAYTTPLMPVSWSVSPTLIAPDASWIDNNSISIYFYTLGRSTITAVATNQCGIGTDSHTIRIEGNNNGNFSISYPNPTSNILNIEITPQTSALESTTDATRLNPDPTYDIRLYDGQGNLLRQKKVKGGKVEFNVASLPNGIYYLHIYDGVNEKPEMRQIVVEK